MTDLQMEIFVRLVDKPRSLLGVILGLVPRICCNPVADARDKPEHDERGVGRRCQQSGKDLQMEILSCI